MTKMDPAPLKRERAEKESWRRILAAARAEFCRAGLAGAKLDVIALEAGVHKQLIHHYFRTKSELYVAVMDDISTQIIRELSNLDYEARDPAAALRLFLHGVFDIFRRWPFMAGLFNDQSLYGGEHMPECRELIARSPILLDRLSKILQAGQRSGVFRPDLDAEAVLGAALMVVLGGFTSGKILSAFLAKDFTTPDKLEFWRDFAIEFSLNAIRAP